MTHTQTCRPPFGWKLGRSAAQRRAGCLRQLFLGAGPCVSGEPSVRVHKHTQQSSSEAVTTVTANVHLSIAAKRCARRLRQLQVRSNAGMPRQFRTAQCGFREANAKRSPHIGAEQTFMNVHSNSSAAERCSGCLRQLQVQSRRAISAERRSSAPAKQQQSEART